MSSANELRLQLDQHFREGFLSRDEAVKAMVQLYLTKARHNLEIMNFLNETVTKSHGVRRYHDWIIVTGYYSMFHAASACLAAICIRSHRSHEALIDALTYYFHYVPQSKSRLEMEQIEALKRASTIEREYLESIRQARAARVVAQYRPSISVETRHVNFILTHAPPFLDRTEEIIAEMGF